ncbi:MAG: RsmE family RNA methyltransferase, partial [Oscillospiraceae bacterium]
MAHRYFTEKINEKTAKILGEDARHLGKVLRVKIGEELTFCDGKGTDFLGKVTAVCENEIELEILSSIKNVSEASVSVTIYVGYPKGDKLELIIQKATELGCVKIVPFFSKFCVVTPKKED